MDLPKDKWNIIYKLLIFPIIVIWWKSNKKVSLTFIIIINYPVHVN